MIYAEDKCASCGKMFVPKTSRQICCSKECTLRRKMDMQKKYKEMHKGHKGRRTRQPKKSITEITIEAREHGMSYGKYVAMKYAGKI